MATQAVAALREEVAARLPGPDASHEELLRGPSWAGPRYYLLVDDYDLVPSQIENPLAPLLDKCKRLPTGRLLFSWRLPGSRDLAVPESQ